jgi:hypothetical protein
MLVVGSGGNMIKEELDRKKISELVRDIRLELEYLEAKFGPEPTPPPPVGLVRGDLNDPDDLDTFHLTLKTANETVDQILQMLEE